MEDCGGEGLRNTELLQLCARVEGAGLSLAYEFSKKSNFGPMHSNSTILVGFFPTGSILRLWPSSQSWN